MVQVKVFVARRQHDVLALKVPRVILRIEGTDMEMEMMPDEAITLGRSLVKQAKAARKMSIIQDAGGNGRG